MCATLASRSPSRPARKPAGDSLPQFLQTSARQVLEGGAPTLSADMLLRIWGARFEPTELHDLVVPERTLSRRLAKKELLTPVEVDRALRVARVSAEADRVFGDPEKATRWLRRPNASLGDQAPIVLMRSEAGTQLVEEKLGQIDHGMFA